MPVAPFIPQRRRQRRGEILAAVAIAEGVAAVLERLEGEDLRLDQGAAASNVDIDGEGEIRRGCGEHPGEVRREPPVLACGTMRHGEL